MSEPWLLAGLSFLLSREWGKVGGGAHAGGESNSLATTQQGPGAHSASMTHCDDCFTADLRGPRAQHILPLPAEKDLVGGKGTASTQNMKKTQRKQRAGLYAPSPRSKAWLVPEGGEAFIGRAAGMPTGPGGLPGAAVPA